MYTSDKLLIKHLLYNIIGAIFLGLFAAIYEAFSHGVYAYYMLFAFAIPLVMGALPYAILQLLGRCPDRRTLNLWNAAIATLSTGSIFEGVLEIYGTTNALIVVYPIAGGVLILLSIVSLMLHRRTRQPVRHGERYETPSRIGYH